MATGLTKAKKYDWKDSNMAKFGTDEDRKVKKESAETEPAWNGVTEISEPTVLVWRINKFKVEKVDKSEYGQFYNGDSYIVLCVKKDQNTLLYDVYFWIGKYSTQDEYGTAAYKTVELDTLLDDKAIQHREVQGNESQSFKDCFKNITILKGGHASGFRTKLPKAYETRLLQVTMVNRRLTVTQIAMKQGNIISDDVFIVDYGTELVQWNGKDSKALERSGASAFIQELKSQRHNCSSRVVDESDAAGHAALMGSLKPGKSEEKEETKLTKSIHRVSDADGSLDMDEVATGHITRDMINDEDVYLILGNGMMFCYVGAGCSIDEKRNAMSYAHEYLTKCGCPLLPIMVLTSDRKNKDFDAVFD